MRWTRDLYLRQQKEPARAALMLERERPRAKTKREATTGVDLDARCRGMIEEASDEAGSGEAGSDDVET